MGFYTNARCSYRDQKKYPTGRSDNPLSLNGESIKISSIIINIAKCDLKPRKNKHETK